MADHRAKALRALGARDMRWPLGLAGGEAAARALGAPCLGEIPNVGAAALAQLPAFARSPAQLLVADPHAAAAVALRALRATLFPARLGARALVLTSAGPAEGKTTIALGLARAAALAGQRALLIGADPDGGGLGALGVDADADPHTSVTIMTQEAVAGQDPSAILAAGRAAFDVVVCDVGAVDAPRALAWAAAADEAVLIARCGWTTASSARAAIARLIEAQALFGGFVLNRAPVRSGT